MNNNNIKAFSIFALLNYKLLHGKIYVVAKHLTNHMLWHPLSPT